MDTEIQRRFLDTKISPIIANLIKKIALYQPEMVVDFICDELESLSTGSAVDLGDPLHTHYLFDLSFQSIIF